MLRENISCLLHAGHRALVPGKSYDTHQWDELVDRMCGSHKEKDVVSLTSSPAAAATMQSRKRKRASEISSTMQVNPALYDCELIIQHTQEIIRTPASHRTSSRHWPSTTNGSTALHAVLGTRIRGLVLCMSLPKTHACE